jgi:serine/threonine protein kinase
MNRTDESAARLLPPSGLWPDEAPEDVRAFLDQHPELRGDKAAALDLAYDEYCRLVEAGELPDADLFCARFPTFQSSLRRAIQAHEYLAANPGLLEERESIPWPVEGETFLGFRLLRELGRGSFARVFLAAEPDLGDRLVAVKISPHGDTEAQTLGRLDHPNVVKVYAVRRDERSGLTAVCMQYLGGATLEGVLTRRAAGASVILDAARAGTAAGAGAAPAPAPHPLLLTGTYAEGVCLLGAQLADALDFLHRQSIYHRDLKPSNVLLCPDGRPTLLDFNLSADPRAGRERLGGTLPYMSPEQVLATFGPERAETPVDGRSDLFSLGVILFELLAGRQPFGEVPRRTPRPEDCAALLERQRQGAPALRGLCPTVTPALARVVAACLAYDRERRPRDAAEVALALRRDLAPHRRLLRRLRHHPRKLAAAAALVATLAAGGAYYEARQPPRADRLIQQAEQEPAAQAIDDSDKAVLLRPDADMHVQRARLKLRERLYAGALGDFREANRLRPEPRLQACVAYCLAREGQHRAAATENEHALDAGFDGPEVHNNLAYSQLFISQIKEARENLARALDLNPRLPAACHNRLVLLRVELQRGPAPALAEVRDALDLALDACPESAELFADAADLCATAAPRAAADDSWDGRAMTHLEHGVRLGLDLGGRPKNPLYTRLRGELAERFAALVNAPRPPSDNTPTARLADPFPGR